MTICILLGNFKFQAIICQWKTLQPEKMITKMVTWLPWSSRFKNLFKYEIWKKLKTACLVNIFEDLRWFLRDFLNIYREEIDDLSVKSFAGRNSSLFSFHYSFGILDIMAKKNYHLRFSGFRLCQGLIVVWNLKLPSQTAKLPSKMRIAVEKSWLSCNER